MMKPQKVWSNLQASFWFLPSLIVLVSIALAIALIQLDSAWNEKWLAQWPRVFGAGAAGARGMLSTIAGSMMTVVGVTFSMVLVTLALASSQYTSRILRNFMRDRVTQVVLGIFAGIFTYCLIVLRTIRGVDDGGFIPSLSVSFGIVLAIGGISVLIFFIHHIASSIQASNIIASVAAETIDAVDRLFPEHLGHESADDDDRRSTHPSLNRIWQPIASGRSGYVQGVDNPLLLRLARNYNTIVRMEHGIGAFVVEGAPLASLALDEQPNQQIIAALQEAYSIDRHRTLEQDAAFGVRQIVDMALRALSPGINDTTTAVMCVDYLTTILGRLASRPIPSAYRYEHGELRVITVGPDFTDLVVESFDQIRTSAGGNVAIMLRMLGALETIASLTTRPSRRQTLRDQMEWTAELAYRTIESPHDLERFTDRLTQVRGALDSEPMLSGMDERRNHHEQNAEHPQSSPHGAPHSSFQERPIKARK